MSYIDDLARQLARGDSSVRVPRSPQVTWHQGTLTAVDASTNTAHYQHNGSGLIIPGVRYLQSYTPDNPPSVGDIVWMQLHGTDPLIVGRHVVPNNLVIP